MADEGYSYFFRDLPHLILIFIIGFMTMVLSFPLGLVHFYPPPNRMEFILIFPYFWNKILTYLSDLNWIVSIIIVLVGSYTFGFIFTGFYDSIGLHVVRRSCRAFAFVWGFIFRIKNERRGWYYWENKIEPFDKSETKNIRNKKNDKYNVGNLEYAALMCWLNEPDNAPLKNYYVWEFLKTVSCKYLSLLIFSMFIVFFLLYLPIQGWQHFIIRNFLDENVILGKNIYSYGFVIVLFIFYLILLYGESYYECAYRKAREYIIKKYEEEITNKHRKKSIGETETKHY